MFGHSGAVLDVKFSPHNSSHLVSASTDKTLKLWDIQTSECLNTFTGHSAPVNGVAFSPNSKFVASCSGVPGYSDNSVRLWDVESGAEVQKFDGHR